MELHDRPIAPESADRAFAGGIRGEFAGHPLAGYIPSPRSLTWLAALLRVERPSQVLEFGGGIGTITATLLRHPCAVERVVTTEHDPRFREILAPQSEPRLHVVASPDELAAMNYDPDLIVLDGGFDDMAGHPIEASHARDGTAVFVDGDREAQRRLFEHELAERGLAVDLSEHGLPRIHTYLYVNWRRRSVRYLRNPKGCWLGRVRARSAAAP